MEVEVEVEMGYRAGEVCVAFIMWRHRGRQGAAALLLVSNFWHANGRALETPALVRCSPANCGSWSVAKPDGWPPALPRGVVDPGV